MSNEKNYVIYMRSVKQRIPCTKEEFDNYYRDINSYRRTQMNHGRCICPKRKRLYCDMDCWTCPYFVKGDNVYLDDIYVDEKGNETNLLNYLQEIMPELQDSCPENDYINKADLERMLVRICEIMPEAIEIGKLREKGLSDTQISEIIKIPRTTFISKLKTIKNILKSEF